VARSGRNRKRDPHTTAASAASARTTDRRRLLSAVMKSSSLPVSETRRRHTKMSKGLEAFVKVLRKRRETEKNAAYRHRDETKERIIKISHKDRRKVVHLPGRGAVISSSKHGGAGTQLPNAQAAAATLTTSTEAEQEVSFLQADSESAGEKEVLEAQTLLEERRVEVNAAATNANAGTKQAQLGARVEKLKTENAKNSEDHEKKWNLAHLEAGLAPVQEKIGKLSREVEVLKAEYENNAERLSKGKDLLTSMQIELDEEEAAINALVEDSEQSLKKQKDDGDEAQKTGNEVTNQTNQNITSPSRVHLVVFADAHFAEIYEQQIQTVRCYANYWGYNFALLPVKLSAYYSHALSVPVEVEVDLDEAAVAARRFNADPTKAARAVKNIPAACRDEDGAITRNAFFVRHCLLAGYLKEIAGEGDAAFLLDADIVARKLTPNLDRWVGELFSDVLDKRPEPANLLQHHLGMTVFDRSRRLNDPEEPEPADHLHPPDMIFFERIWGLSEHNEIMAGSYLARNTERARTFLRKWAGTAKTRPPGFSSADNGALHLVVLRALGMSTRDCEDQFAALTAKVDDLGPYSEFVRCSREALGMGATPPDIGGEVLVLAAETKVRAPTDESSDHVDPISAAKATVDESLASPLDVVHQDGAIAGIRISILPRYEAWAPDYVYRKRGRFSSPFPFGHGMKHMDDPRAQTFLEWKDIPNCEDNEGRKAVVQMEHLAA